MQLIQCPSCGGSNEVRNPGITMISCKYCQSTLFWDDAIFIHTGAKAVLPEKDSRLWLGATGKIKGQPFEVMGRIRFTYSLGHYDEWFIALDGDFAWLGETGRELTLRRIIHNPEEIMGHQHPALGTTLILENNSYSIRTADRAQCAAIEGELPFAVPPTESINYFDAVSPDGRGFAALSYNLRNQLRLTIGEPLDHGDLQLDGEEPLIAQYDNMSDGKTLSCASCGAALPRNILPGTVSVTCPACSSINDICHEAPQYVGKVRHAELAQKFIYAINDNYRHKDVQYSICGRQILQFNNQNDIQLYLLYNEAGGYKYLEKSDLGTFLFEKTLVTPEGNIQQWLRLQNNDTLNALGNSYQVKNNGHTTITYVDGAFPWLATVGEENFVLNALSGHDLYRLERTRTELHFFTGSAVSTITANSKKQTAGANKETKNNTAAKAAKTVTASETDKKGKKNNKALTGCAIGCAAFLALNILSLAFLIWLDSEDVTADDAQAAIATLHENAKNFNDQYYTAWQEMTDTAYLPQLLQDSYAPHIATIMAYLDSASDQEARLATLTPEDSDFADITNKLIENNNRYPEIARDLESLLPIIKEREYTLTKLRDFHDEPYEQMIAWSKEDPQNDWQPLVKLALENWPEKEEALAAIKKDRDAKKAAVLEAFNQVEQLHVTEKSLTRDKSQDFCASYDKYVQLIDPFNQANKLLRTKLDALYEKQETILLDLYQKNSNGSVSYIAKFREITYYISDQQPQLKNSEEERQLTGKEYQQLTDKLGLTIKYKKQGEFYEEAHETMLPPGYTILPAPGQKNSAGSWQGDKVIFNGEESKFVQAFWSGCPQPPAAVYDKNFHNNTEFIGSSGRWTKECYQNANYYKQQDNAAAQPAATEKPAESAPKKDISSRFHSTRKG